MAGVSRKRPKGVRSQANHRRHVIGLGAAIFVLATALAGLLGYLGYLGPAALEQSSDNQEPEAEEHRPALAANQDQFLLPAITRSPFRNTAKSVEYVGSRACLECHRDEHESYLQTTHSRSLAKVDVSNEPPSGEFHHELSGRHYRIYRDDETLRLREFIHDANGQEVVLVDHAARFVLGSGNYARMYLVQVGDFLIEAPVTWYPRRKSWGMSAGYEKDPHQVGFGREVDLKCMNCHAGRTAPIGGAAQRLHVKEMAIGCERCHGPGALHVQLRQAELADRGGKAELTIQGSIDDSIVNLRHLARKTQEDVCSQCHLSASADVNVRGRSVADFRPGLRMADFLVSFRVDRPDSAMTVSGQIEQMRLSRCYVESESMTCTTCHNPHSLPDAAERVAYYRNKCLSCHPAESCGLPVETRQADAPQDNCIICHMPRGPTDIPHFSFTHHRVGIHATKTKSDKLTAADHLVPVVDVAHLPDHERQRLLGLANDIFAGKLAGGLNDESRDDPSYRALAKVFEERGRQLLERVRSRGLRDPDIELFFSRMYWRKNPDQCIAFAESALTFPQISPTTRQSALYNLASSHFDQRRFGAAFPYLEELVKIERSEISLMLMGICHQGNRNLPEAVRMVHEAIGDAPDRADLHIYLASLYRSMGQTSDAERHMQLAKLLSLRVPQPQ